jgi:hypothetical protein
VSGRGFDNLSHTALTGVKRELEERRAKVDAALGQLAEAGDTKPGHYESILRLGGARKAYGDMLSYVNALLKEES